jgi:hypothetical protein
VAKILNPDNVKIDKLKLCTVAISDSKGAENIAEII